MKTRAIVSCIVVAITVAASLLGSGVWAGSSGTVYSTWQDSMEIDKCASAWLIARFVDKGAQFKFIPQGTLIAHYKVDDPAVVAIGGIIREIELSRWSDKQSDLAASLPKLVEGIRLIAKDDGDCLRQGFIIMDALYAYTRKQVGG